MENPHQQAIEATLAASGAKLTYTGAGAASISWFLSSEFGILVGVVIGVCGFLVQLYYSHKRDRREQEAHERRMRGNDSA